MSGFRFAELRTSTSPGSSGICLVLLGTLLALGLVGLTALPGSLAAAPDQHLGMPMAQQQPPRAAGLAASTTVTLTALADARISQTAPDQPYGSEPQLVVACNVGGKLDLSLIRFDLGALPLSITVTRGTLRVLATDLTGGTSPITVSLRRTTEPWDEGTVKWSNRPTVGAVVTTTAASGQGWATWDITTLVRGWYETGNNYGLQLGGPAAQQYELYMSAREGLHAPELVVSCDTEPTPTSTATLARPTPSSTPTTTTPPYYDLGDAPDSSNSYGITMTAYAGVAAQFPTVFEWGSPPYGPRHGNNPSLFFLGNQISLEFEADYGQDQDQGVHNIDPYTDSADQDKRDDGLALPATFADCQPTTLQFTVTVLAGTPRQAYVNLWFDWNRNGRWGDVSECQGAASPEWAVQNQVINLSAAGTFVTYTSAFLPFNPDSDKAMWLRITLSEDEAPSANGSGPRFGYDAGETEDYLLRTIPPAMRVYLPVVLRYSVPPLGGRMSR